MARQRKVPRRVGDIVRIDLGDGTHSYALVLKDPLLAFFDVRADVDLDVSVVCNRSFAFKIWVMNSAITTGRWPIAGHVEPCEADLSRQWFWKQDPISKKLTIYSEGEELNAEAETCRNLERAAVWDAGHVEDRLRDHFAGVPNKWVESLRFR